MNFFGGKSTNNPYAQQPDNSGVPPYPTPPPRGGQPTPQYYSQSNSPQPYQSSTPPRIKSSRYSIVNAPDSTYVISNHAAVPVGSFQDGEYIIVDGKYVFTAQ